MSKQITITHPETIRRAEHLQQIGMSSTKTGAIEQLVHAGYVKLSETGAIHPIDGTPKPRRRRAAQEPAPA